MREQRGAGGLRWALSLADSKKQLVGRAKKSGFWRAFLLSVSLPDSCCDLVREGPSLPVRPHHSGAQCWESHDSLLHFRLLKPKSTQSEPFCFSCTPKAGGQRRGPGCLLQPLVSHRISKGAASTCVCFLQLSQPAGSPGARPWVRPSVRAVLEGFGPRWQLQHKARTLRHQHSLASLLRWLQGVGCSIPTCTRGEKKHSGRWEGLGEPV